MRGFSLADASLAALFVRGNATGKIIRKSDVVVVGSGGDLLAVVVVEDCFY